jgi:hypothetical protein
MSHAGLVLEIGDIPNEAEFSYCRLMHDYSWCVGLMVRYSVRNIRAQSLGGRCFAGYGTSPREAAMEASAKLASWVEAERLRSYAPVKSAHLLGARRQPQARGPQAETKLNVDDILGLVSKKLGR